MKEPGRKFTFFSVAFVVITWLVAKDHIPPEVYKDLFWACAFAFSGGNVAEHFAKRGQS